jgi:hypothetical protein
MLSFDFGWAGEWYTVTLTEAWVVGLCFAVWAILAVIIIRLSVPHEYTEEEFDLAMLIGTLWPLLIVLIVVLGPIMLICAGLKYILTAGKKSRY